MSDSFFMNNKMKATSANLKINCNAVIFPKSSMPKNKYKLLKVVIFKTEIKNNA